MATLNTTNPEYLTWEYEQVGVAILGGIRIEGLDRMRVTLKIQWKEQVIRHNLDLYNDAAVDKLVKRCAGFEHILSHEKEFAQLGIPKEQIAQVVFDAATNGKVVGTSGTRSIYETIINGQVRNLAITIGNNGYIVGANPVTKVK